MSDNPADFIDPDKCPKCQGPLFDAVDMGDGSHYITCHTKGCKRVEYKEKLIACPFCREDDFDLIGLKFHLLQGHCPEFENTEGIHL